MIVPITGNVTYTITLDPTAWIFDDRKILLDEAFTEQTAETDAENEVEEASKRWERAVKKPNLNSNGNKGIPRSEREEILSSSYVMPISNFVDYAEVNGDAEDVTLETSDGDVRISLEELQKCYLQFSLNGKPLKEDGPVYFFYRDGSNKDNPVKGIKKIVIN
ncbi:hypothetical protein [Virgibacillus doumboii]|uniref:hypothetical protein n=1 Tax=Virgibacillus doumboii TaxID=2697503 RepID=UPI0013E0BBF9|nr:hypothetical protein [Virgibacillus doumboii]